MREAGVGVIVKLDTLIVTVTVWLSSPLVPSTSTLYVPGMVSAATDRISSAPAEDVIVETLNDVTKSSVDGIAVRLTVPENPLRAVSVIIELELEPSWTVSGEGVAESEKSGPITVTEIVK